MYSLNIPKMPVEKLKNPFNRVNMLIVYEPTALMNPTGTAYFALQSDENSPLVFDMNAV